MSHHFKSRQLPLGVLSAKEFDATVEYFSYASQSARLLLCSDGAIDLLGSAGRNIDRAELIKGMAHSSMRTHSSVWITCSNFGVSAPTALRNSGASSY